MSESAPLLDGVLVLDMSQFLSGPFAALRLADLGARVIKIERPDGGDLCRRLYLSDTELGGDSTLFHAINRGKECFAADFRDERDRAAITQLIARADVVIQNFRPGVIERLGFGYEQARQINPRVVYASISGYGEEGPWRGLPGQDLLAQARSGVMWLNGDPSQGPVPFGLAVADLLAGAAAAQGMLAGLVKAARTGVGAHVQTSLLEALVDFQFEVLATYLNDGGRLPQRSEFRNAHAYLSAPYGVYQTEDGWLALAMTPLAKLAPLLETPELADLAPDAPFRERDAIKTRIAAQLRTRSTAAWLAVLQPHDIWCSEVLNWPEMFDSENFRLLDMVQTLRGDDGLTVKTLRSPIRVNGARSRSERPAPRIGADTERLRAEFALS